MLFDSHAHLQDLRLESSVSAVLEQAAAAGIRRIACCGTSEADWPRVAGLCRRNSQLVPCFGLHPWHAHGRSSSWKEALMELLVEFPSAAVGEIGLDRARDPATFEEQKKVFEIQLELAARLARPAVIHSRRAWDVMPAMIRDLPIRFMIHAWSGSVEMMACLAETGGYFSFSGSLTRKGDTKARRSAVQAPRSRLLIETDSPDMPPHGMTGPNQPANLVLVNTELAHAIEMNASECAALTYRNACAFYGIAENESF